MREHDFCAIRSKTLLLTYENEKSISDDPRFTYPSVSKPLFETYKKIEAIKNVNIKEGVAERQEIQRKGEQIIYDLYSAFEDVMKLHYQNNHDTNEEDSRIRAADEEARMLNKQMLSETEGAGTDFGALG